MSEDTFESREAIPRIMVWSNVINGLLAFAMNVIVFYTLGPLDDILDSEFPLLEICLHATSSRPVASAMVCSLFLLRILNTVSNLASTSRLTLSWSRDRGISTYFSRVSLSGQSPSKPPQSL